MRLGLGEAARTTTRLRGLLAERRPLVVPGCYNALTARILEHAGHEAIYMTGYGTSLSLLGLPDAGLITLTEMALNARLIAGAVRAPVIADADTGFGNAINLVRTIEEYIRAGVAGLHIEDQVAPKRCGHVAGREVIDREEAVGKIRAAHATRQALDPEFVLVARTDARGAHGGSLDEAITRANLFLEAGADLAFVEGPASKAEIAEVCRRVHGPVFYNQTGISPRLSEAEMAELGIAVTILPGAVLRQTIMAVHDLAVALKQQGALAEAEVDARTKTHPLGNLHLFAGFDRIRALEEGFLPTESQQKYAGTLGHLPEAKG
ncbi:carboxyvinyl-carboxyphosphonate phosphorylmutase [Siccirubricoccus deserti]|uniref:Isocitrate lyase/PEP mutase family protein n=1 Tax=Siccirubricoccus deserti TaxID=2013562 RepID=A0A9X0UF80_9PROT|nr:isocitrate lyase/PEP mutase family protein [Siccirubricoccus deserti]MBC4014140.1 isocitrate lyase/PEP mutase family protein [Siccirubricoccus deserti]GGC26788.1 carboxyvinyl-carboxyphosphonate phosphorylmutase [Siccirubricoccus deserti]